VFTSISTVELTNPKARRLGDSPPKRKYASELSLKPLGANIVAIFTLQIHQEGLRMVRSNAVVLRILGAITDSLPRRS